MAKENRILAIDVGCDSLKMAEFTYTSNGGMVNSAIFRLSQPTSIARILFSFAIETFSCITL